MVENQGESRGNQLLRYLQALVAWPGAVNKLLDNEFRMLLNDNLSVGLVKVQPCKSLLCSMKDMMYEYVSSFSPILAAVLTYFNLGCYSEVQSGPFECIGLPKCKLRQCRP